MSAQICVGCASTEIYVTDCGGEKGVSMCAECFGADVCVGCASTEIYVTDYGGEEGKTLCQECFWNNAINPNANAIIEMLFNHIKK